MISRSERKDLPREKLKLFSQYTIIIA